jgi:hypothetical protein
MKHVLIGGSKRFLIVVDMRFTGEIRLMIWLCRDGR